MHRTEGPDYITESGKRRYKETPIPGTVVNKFHMNALQEEICLAIENVGMTIAATGAADRTAGWGQLYKAMMRGPIGNILSYGADPTGATDSKAAIQAALDDKKFIYIPKGAFKILSSLTLPDGGGIIGEGYQSKLFGSGITTLSLGAVDFYLNNFRINGVSGSSVGLNCVFSADKTVYANNLFIDGSTFGLVVKATSGVQGKFFGKNIYLDSMATNFSFGHDTEGDAELIAIEGLYSDNATTNYIMGKSAGGGEMILSNSKIYDGIIEWRDETKKMWIVNSFIDVDVMRFDNTSGGGFRNCQLGALSNTFTHNYNTSSSRIFIINMRDKDGKLSGSDNIDGIRVSRNRATSSQTIAATSEDNVDFNNESARVMATNPSYTKDDPWDGTNHEFDVLGYGDGHVKLHTELDIQMATDTLANIADVNCYIQVNSSKVLQLARNVQIIHATTGRCTFAGSILIPVEVGDTVSIVVDNDQSSSVSVLHTTVAKIRIEGL